MSQGDESNLHAKKAIKFLLIYPDETIDDLESSTFITRSRGSGTNSYLDVTSTENDDNSIKKSLSFKNSSFSDDDFLNADAAKQMILKDQEENEKESTLQIADSNITGCSAWVPLSAERLSVLSITNDVEQLHVAVGECIAMRSEKLGSLCEDPSHSKIFFGLNTSTPIKVQNEMSTADLIANGRTCLRNIERLRAEEKMASRKATGNLSRDQSEFTKLDVSKTFINASDSFCRYFGDTDLRSSSSCNSSGKYTGKESVIAQWDVQPQDITLNSTKGNRRVLLINNSAQDMKFKVKFDVNVINVSPLSGTVPARGQIGLRITVIRSAKAKENVEDVVKIISGNTEKIISIKIAKEKQSKMPFKDRSFILY